MNNLEYARSLGNPAEFWVRVDALAHHLGEYGIETMADEHWHYKLMNTFDGPSEAWDTWVDADDLPDFIPPFIQLLIKAHADTWKAYKILNDEDAANRQSPISAEDYEDSL